MSSSSWVMIIQNNMATPATKNNRNLPTVVLVGRANVGKSTLFNKLVEMQKALVSDIPGTTRTNNEGILLWRGRETRLIDTGGLDSLMHKEIKFFDQEIQAQAQMAIGEADVILFITDAKSGILPQEKKLADELFKKNKKKIPIILVANKVDTTRIEMGMELKEWMKLGCGAPFAISAANGRQVGDLLDLVYRGLHAGARRPKDAALEIEDIITVSIVGKPNVGKSSLFNKLIGEEKVIVSAIPHTTRESFDTTVVYNSHTITFIDTAGMRRKAQVEGVLEREGISKTFESILASKIVLMVIDGADPLSAQDKQIAGLIEQHGKSAILLVNKWDLAEDNTDAYRNGVKAMLLGIFPHLDFAPILFVSGLTGYRVHQIFPILIEVAEARKREIPQDELDRFLKEATHEHRPTRGKGVRHPEILGIQQLATDPPVFELLIKPKTSLHYSYARYIENRLREEFGFIGTPIIIKFSKLKR